MNKKTLERITSYRNASFAPGTLVELLHEATVTKIKDNIATIDLLGKIYTAGSNSHKFLVMLQIPLLKYTAKHINPRDIRGYVICSVPVDVIYITEQDGQSRLNGRKIFNPDNNLYYFIPDCCLKRVES